MKKQISLAVAALAATVGCNDHPRAEAQMDVMHARPVSVASVDSATWRALASRPIFFGHQSVGRNILAGLRILLREHPEIPLRLVSTSDPGQVRGGALIESNIGENGQPDVKADAFAAALAFGFGDEQNAVAMYKYCYADILPTTDPERLFKDYVERMERLRRRYPDLTIVHFTIPLRRADTGWKEQIKTMLGRATQTELNQKRNRYNQLLRQHYSAKAPIFDLAYLESLRPDGSRAFSSYLGRRVYMLAPESTEDGGHLNEAAQTRVAEEFLVFLANLEKQRIPNARKVVGSVDNSSEVGSELEKTR